MGLLQVSVYIRRAAITGIFLLLLSGCAVGPDFRPPEAPETDAYTPSPAPSETESAPVAGGEPQSFLYGRDIPAQWWTLFRSESLDGVIRRALADSPTLLAAQAALRQAVEDRRARFGALFPELDGNFSGSRRQFTGATFGQPDVPGSILTLYNASVSVSYTLDFFGATRREVEALQAQVEYRRYLLEAAHLTLAANLVTTAVQEASLRARVRATQEILAAEEELLELMERSYRLGGASLPDVLAQRTQLSQTRTTLPPLESELDQTRHLLATLAGILPSNAETLPGFELEDFRLPINLPVSLPSALVRQRPDIRASEALLHAASAQVGVATANLFPQLTITGDYGTESTVLNDLFSPGTTVWSIGGKLLQPVFRGGELTAKRRSVIAAFDQVGAQYRETVLQALKNVADVLRALEGDARTLKAQTEAENDARETLELTKKRYTYGSASYPALLDAQRQHLQAVLGLARARAARLSDTAALFQALGGGWWNRAEPLSEAQGLATETAVDESGKRLPHVKTDKGASNP